MKQTHLEDSLYDYISRRMNEDDYHLAEEHLQGCEGCQKEVEELKKTLNLLDQFQPPSLSADFKDEVIQRIRDLPPPPKPLFQRIKEQIQIPYIKWPLQGLAVAVVLLLALTIYKDFTPEGFYEFEKLPKELQIELAEVKNPIIIETDSIDTALENLKGLIQAHNGKVLQVIRLESGIKITFGLDKGEEVVLFDNLKLVGKVHMKSKGYRDAQGNIVVLLIKEGM